VYHSSDYLSMSPTARRALPIHTCNHLWPSAIAVPVSWATLSYILRALTEKYVHYTLKDVTPSLIADIFFEYNWILITSLYL